MSFFRKLLDRFYRFMYGRYGADTLFYVLFGIINTVNDKAKELPLIGKITLLK